MSYCLNPACLHPQNPEKISYCQSCGFKLLLQERYRARQLIGQGGFGRTFLAVDEYHLSKPLCAIKQFFPQNNHPKAAELFYQEALQLAVLGKHPHEGKGKGKGKGEEFAFPFPFPSPYPSSLLSDAIKQEKKFSKT